MLNPASLKASTSLAASKSPVTVNVSALAATSPAAPGTFLIVSLMAIEHFLQQLWTFSTVTFASAAAQEAVTKGTIRPKVRATIRFMETPWVRENRSRDDTGNGGNGKGGADILILVCPTSINARDVTNSLDPE